jgi:uncharacterized protein
MTRSRRHAEHRDLTSYLPGNHVIWLDDLDRFLSGGCLTAGLVVRLAEHNAIVATLRAREWDRFQPTDQLRPPEWDVLIFFDKVTLDRDLDRPSDEDLARAVPDVELRDRITRVGIGEYVGAGQHVADQLVLGAQSHPLGYALVRGAVDWRRTGVARPVPASLLPALAAAHLTPRQCIDLTDSEKYADALAWATREINPTVALLESGDGVFTVYDFALDRLTATDDAPPAATWRLVVDNSEPGELVTIGYQAKVTYGHDDVAEWAWRRAAEAGHLTSMSNLGILLHERGNLSEAESWSRRATEDGDIRAMNNLGAILYNRGDLDEAESWYRRAVEAGNTTAMEGLGLLLMRRGDLDEAESWWRRAVEDGNTGPMTNLGLLLKERGDLDEAETWYRRAAEDGNTTAMNNLGVILKDRGDSTEAETWWLRAAEDGNVTAMHNLWIMLEWRGDLTEATTWRRLRAAEDGHTGSN